MFRTILYADDQVIVVTSENEIKIGIIIK